MGMNTLTNYLHMDLDYIAVLKCQSVDYDIQVLALLDKGNCLGLLEIWSVNVSRSGGAEANANNVVVGSSSAGCI